MKRKGRWSPKLVVLGVGVLALSAFVTPRSGQVKSKTETPAAPGSPIAVQDHEVDGVEVALLEVKRASGDTVNIRWQYRNKTNETKALQHGAAAGMDSFRFASDAYFLDANQNKYVVLKDAQGYPQAAKHEQFKFSISLAPKQTVNTWAKFAAPPADVEKVNVYLPGAPPFEDIGIGK